MPAQSSRITKTRQSDHLSRKNRPKYRWVVEPYDYAPDSYRNRRSSMVIVLLRFRLRHGQLPQCQASLRDQGAPLQPPHSHSISASALSAGPTGHSSCRPGGFCFFFMSQSLISRRRILRQLFLSPVGEGAPEPVRDGGDAEPGVAGRYKSCRKMRCLQDWTGKPDRQVRISPGLRSGSPSPCRTTGPRGGRAFILRAEISHVRLSQRISPN